MAKKKVFVSFDYMEMINITSIYLKHGMKIQISSLFDDKTSREINSDNVDRIKAALTSKIRSATYTLVIVGEYANEEHEDSDLIGDINWINWEINRSKEEGNKLVGIKIKRSYESPDALLGCCDAWAYSFTQESIINALNEA